MTAGDAILSQILFDVKASWDDPTLPGSGGWEPFDWNEADSETPNELYNRTMDVDMLHDWVRDAEEEFRSSGQPTGLPCGWSRHYECCAVAAQLHDGRWVGWDYWYGGGKHGEPAEMPWLEDAYFLDVTTKMEPVLHFTKSKEQG